MKNKYTQFLIRLIILSLITGLLAFLLSRFAGEGTVTSAFPGLLLMFFTITAVVHYVLLRITALNPRKFVGYFMLATTLKLLVYIIVVFAYLFIVRTGILQFILAFFVLYIIYTVYEVVTILSQTKS